MRRGRVCVLIVMALAGAGPSAQVQADKLLTAADVTRITKVAGVKIVPPNPTTGASGDVNFADGAGELLVIMNVKPAAEFQMMKRIAAGPVDGVGEEAFQAPNAKAAAGMAPYMLIFRKGSSAVMLTSFFDASGKPRVPQAQLKELALVVVGTL